MHLSFKLYLSNEASNELLTKTKVVDLEILSKFGIQKFFIWGLIEGEKLILQTAFWNFELITRLPSTPSLLCSRRSSPFAAGRRGRRPRAVPLPRPRPNHLVRPRFRSKLLPLALLERDTRPAVPCLPRHTRMAVVVPPCRAISLPLKPSSPFHDAKLKFASSSSRARARAQAPCTRGAARHRHGRRARLVVASPPSIPFSPN